MPDPTLRFMTMEDIPGAIGLSAAAGWNQTAADWARFLEASPEGCFVVEDLGKVIGTSATIGHEGKFAWIGMLIVEEAYRGRGIGTALLEKAMNSIKSRNIPAMKLDATPKGRPLYEKLGFVSEYEIERWMLNRPTKEKAAGDGPADMKDIMPMDREIFGADRSGLLISAAREAPHLALLERQDGKINGYAFGRTGQRADQMGPWVARSIETAERLLDLFIERSAREIVFVDCLSPNPRAVELVKARGFEFSRSLTRMYRGENRYPGRTEYIYASLGPEFG